MAAISAARGAPSALTPPSSSHGDEPSWRYRDQHEEAYDRNGAGYYDDEAPRGLRQNGNSNHFDSAFEAKAQKTQSDDRWDAHAESGVQSPVQFDNIRSDWSTGEPETDDPTEAYRGRADSQVTQEVESKWIHRDILAQIESEELEAAGFIPRSRAPSKQRRDKSARRGTDAQEHRSKQGQVPETGDASASAYATEDATDEQGNASAGQNAKGGSRIPVAKTRSRSASATLRELTTPAVAPEKPKPAQRSATETSPKKMGAAGRKNTEPANSKPKTAAGRPKTRSGPSKDSTNGARPSTRSGEASLSSTKQPEGNPPWMVNSYRPDPRLPPDQQLIPTVAKRLQQEKWEQEGTFGTAYDKDFRPLNDSPLFRENSVPLAETKQEPPAQEEVQIQEAGPSDEWPLRAEPPKSLVVRLGSSYSTMPKISDVQPPKSPLPGQRPPMTPQGTTQSQSQLSEKAQSAQRIPDVPDDQDQKGGCGCCVIM
ncbi:hypothetical protein TARUN_8973 [Trichoderma arundinaceum]|uniref:TeaA receptor TeaR n=1 Tax=Trichoderma arundinaceum TaxID=490622 RepID=A0A395NBL5_TRIAR|nr:hypothetical protein TARUN_8973 [Trichoderma arundinaceum]